MVEISSWFSLFTQVCLLLTPHQDSWLVFPLNLLCGSNHSTYGFFLYFSNRVYTVYSGLLQGIHGLAPTFIIPSLLLCLLPHWKTCSLNMPVFCFFLFFAFTCVFLCLECPFAPFHFAQLHLSKTQCSLRSSLILAGGGDPVFLRTAISVFIWCLLLQLFIYISWLFFQPVNFLKSENSGGFSTGSPLWLCTASQ